MHNEDHCFIKAIVAPVIPCNRDTEAQGLQTTIQSHTLTERHTETETQRHRHRVCRHNKISTNEMNKNSKVHISGVFPTQMLWARGFDT